MRNPPPQAPAAPAPTPRRRATAFSLIEITLALGIVTFALVGVIGVLPVAVSSSRQSIDKNRAAAIASTLYASLRSQPFQKVCYLTTQFQANGTPNAAASGQLDLNALSTTNPPVKFHANFLDTSAPGGSAADDSFGKQRRLCFTSDPSGGADYLVTMRFNNQPEGTTITPVPGETNGMPRVPAQANQVELVISPVSRPADQYRYISIIANRTN